ncbi:MAG: type I restriction enzyme HsdR N-terminal domain-containing protein [Planctomycetes bacterium]|nr:type I restriction enzyme HsdR N-terminal domain-containing protein [Planctomycetota bacterium]
MSIDIRKPLKKFLPHLCKANEAGLNEADTVQRLIKFFDDVLGYDTMTEISRETEMKGKYVDIALKIDGTVRILVEAKAAGEKLRDRHIEQAQSYASRNNYHWVILTNGTEWILYHLTFGEGIEYTRAFTIDLMDDAQVETGAEKLALLSRTSVKRGELDEFWEHTNALSPAAIGRALFLEEVLNVIRREIRRKTEVSIDQEDLADAIHGMLSPEAREQIGPMKIRKRKGVTKKVTPDDAAAPKSGGGLDPSPAPGSTAVADLTPPPTPPPQSAP